MERTAIISCARWINGNFFKAKLRFRNQYISTDIREFLEPLLEKYSQVIPTIDILVRGDSGIVTPDIYKLFEVYNNDYMIRLKNNRTLNNWFQLRQITKH